MALIATSTASTIPAFAAATLSAGVGVGFGLEKILSMVGMILVLGRRLYATAVIQAGA